MGFIGKQPTPVPLTSNDITDGIITTSKIADDAVGNTKLDLTANYAFTGTVTGAETATPVFRLEKNAQQTISTATSTSVTWQTTVIDTNSIADLSNNRVNITAATAGRWFIGVGLYYSGRAQRNLLWIYKNGSNVAGYEDAVGSGNSGTYPTVFGSSAIITVADGDNISVATYHNYGSNLNIATGSNATWFNGFRITTV